MKFTAAVLALLAVSADGFSLTMSSYLDNLGSAATSASTSSWAPAPAPAPVTYQSSLAGLPANSELNYIKTIAGGSAMKPGKNYSGMGSSFKMAPSTLYQAPEPAAAPATPSYSAPAPAPAAYQSSISAPANSNLDYMSTIAGGSAMKGGKNYSGMNVSWKSAAPASSTPSYTAPAPAPVAYESSAADVPANSNLNYMSTISGGSAMKSGKNYSGMNVSWKSPAPATPSYSEPAPAPAAYSSSSSDAVANSNLNYMSTISGGSAMKPGKNYSGMNVSWKSPAPAASSYAPAEYSSSSDAVANSNLNYMSTISGGSAMKAGKNYSGMNVSWKSPAPVASSYSEPAAAPAAYESSADSVPANSNLNYMSTISGGSAMKSGKNYSGMNVSWKSPAPATPSYSQPAAYSTPAPAPAAYESSAADVPANSNLNYMSTIAGGSAMKSGKNYSGMNVSWKSSSPSTPAYTAPAPAPASYSYTPAPAPVPEPASYTSSASAPANSNLDYMSTISGGSAMKSGRNYSGMSSSFREPASAVPSYLDNVKGASLESFASYSAPAPAPQPASYESSWASAPAPAPQPASYQSSYGSSTPKSYSAFGRKMASASTGIGSYLENI